MSNPSQVQQQGQEGQRRMRLSPMAQQIMTIHDIHSPLEQFVIWADALNEEEIRDVISIGEMAEFQQGVVGGSSLNSDHVLDTEVRDNTVSVVMPSEQTEWLYNRIQQIISKVNYDKFQFDLGMFEILQYAKYKEGQFYDWHCDAGPNLGYHRKLSVVVGLTDSSEYEGGDFVINYNGNPDKCETIRLLPGQILIFPSWVPHKVTPVTSGERVTLVTWVNGPKFR
jgi:PKHD-type hydroxylase